jgi:Ca-activated chloride channel homolog
MPKAATGVFLAALSTGAVIFAPVAAAQTPPETDPDKTLAPYFVVPGSDPATESLPLKETSAEVAIAGVIARVKVKQLFENTAKNPIEAVYVFPASTRAAVHGMRMKIGQRTIEARIDRRAKARADYEAARQEGKRASLLEQERPNVFTMNVANILPGDKIAVELEYSEMVVPEEGIYEFVYPTVVGPRYGGGASKTADRWIENPYLKQGSPQPYRFDLRAHLETGIPLKELSSPSHKVNVTYDSPARANVRLEGPGGGNRDFVLRYRLADDRIETGVLLWEGPGANNQTEKFFALMMEPPARPRPAQIPPREYIFLVDVSGSMHGFPLDTAKTLMRKLLGSLRPIDQFNLVLFAGGSRVLSADGSLTATQQNVAQAIALLEQQQGGGGTELLKGLQSSYQIPRRDRQLSRSVVVITDGYVGVEAQTFRFIRDRLDQANLFAFGIGSSVNRGLIEGMARAGVGEPFVVLKPDGAAAEADRFRAYIEQPVLTEISVRFNGFDTTDVTPEKLPDLMARRPLVLFGKYRGPAGGRIEIGGITGTGRFHQTVQVRPENQRADNTALRWLWARNRVAVLDDDRLMAGSQTAEPAITNLGLEYSLLTAFTSFVAIDSQVVNQGGKAATVKQPLPLPEGVADSAVGSVAYALSGSAGGVVGGGLGGVRMMKRGQSYDLNLGTAPLMAPSPATRSARPAMPAPATPPPAREPAKAAGTTAEEGKARATAVQLLASDSVGDTKPLMEKVKQLLAAGSCRAGSALRVRITIDAGGRVNGLKLLEGDQRQLTCLERVLLKLTTATKAHGKPVGTVDLRLE